MITEVKIDQEFKKTFPWRLVVIFMLFTLGIVFVGINYYKSQRNRIFSEYQNNLSAIASLKVHQIEQWNKERLGFAATISENEPLLVAIKQYFREETQPGIRTELTKWMESVNREYDYSGVLLIDSSLKVRLSVPPSDTLAGDEIRKELENVMRNPAIIMTDLHMANCISYIHLDLIIPLIDPVSKEHKPFGVLILRIDPDKRLFPLIQSWPTPSKSSETLLLRQDGDSVLYLNELRHKKNTALKLKLSLADKNLLASKVASGEKGVVEGVDYRNIPVVGYISDIPGFKWFMVSKVDKDEIQEPLKSYFYYSILVTLLLILINASFFVFWIWNQRVIYYRSMLKKESDIRDSEEKLHETNEYLTNLIKYANAPIIVWDTELIITQFNHAFEHLSGYCAEEVIGKKIEILFSKEKTEYSLDLIARAVSGERWESVEIEIQRNDGDTRIVLWNSANILDKDDKTVVATIAQGNDITERKKAELSLGLSEEKYKRTFESANIGISLTGIDGSLANINDAFCQMLGYTKKELSQMGFAQVTFPEDIAESKECVRSILAGERETYRMEKRYLRKDGSIMWADVNTMLLRNENGNPIHFITHIIDITEQKNSEQERFRLSDIIEKSINEIYVFHADTLKFDYVNPGALQNIGYTLGEMKSMTPVDIKPEFTEEQFRSLVKPLVTKEKRRLVFETIHRRKDGSVYPVEVSLQYLEQLNKKLFYSIINDITERKHAEKEILELNEELEHRVIQRTIQYELANKELEAFSYSVSHDLRAPLRTVHGYTKILLEEYENKLDDEGKRLCGIVLSGAAKMGALIDDLLSFSRVGRTSLKPTLLDMKSLATDVFAEISSDKEKKRTKLKIANLHKSYADANMIRLVWNNLISNAIKYSSKKEISEISIKSKHVDDMIIYSIKDNGIGFEMQYVHKLFGVFQRLHSESEFEGNGVGLANVKRIIQKHNGNVWAEGDLEKGATFYFSLPADEIIRRVASKEERQQETDDRQATTDDRQQETDDRQSTTEDRQQETEDRQATTKDRQQETDDRQTTTEDRQQKTDDRQSTTKDRQQETDDRQTTTEDRQQETDDRQTTTKDRQQETDDRQTTTEDRQQKTDDRQSTTEDRQQETDDRQRTTKDRQQATEDRQLATEGRQQTTDDRQKATEDRQKANQKPGTKK